VKVFFWRVIGIPEKPGGISSPPFNNSPSYVYRTAGYVPLRNVALYRAEPEVNVAW
jgi:hypothetical protein